MAGLIDGLGGDIDLSRNLHVECLMRPDPIELVTPLVEERLRCFCPIRRGQLQFRPDVPMDAFMGAVLIRASRSNAIQTNTQGHPPTGQATET